MIKMLQHLGKTAKTIQSNSTTATISPQDYITYWRGRSDRTPSSFSGLHFGHWKAANKYQNLATIHAKAVELSFQTGAPLHRWSVGLSVMLEKLPGVINVEKLRAILLMEAYFNFANKICFGRRLKLKTGAHNIIPQDLFESREDHSSIEVALCRFMFLI